VKKRDVTLTAVSMERLGKHVSAEANSSNNGRVVFSVWSVPRSCKKDKEDRLSQMSFETPTCQDMSLGAEKLHRETSKKKVKLSL
jgi:hypothetical protein